MRCPNCGNVLPSNARFCGRCGQRLPTTTPQPQSSRPPAGQRRRLPRWVLALGAVITLLALTIVVIFAALYFWLGLHRTDETATVAPADETVAFVSLQPSPLQLAQWRNLDTAEKGTAALLPLALSLSGVEMGATPEELLAPVDQLHLDFREDILPWIGPEISLILLSEEEVAARPAGRAQYHAAGPPVVLAAIVRDEQAARDFLSLIEQQLAGEVAFDGDHYRGIDYRYVTTEEALPLAFAVDDGLLLVAANIDALQRALDTRLDGRPTLADKEMFQQITDALPTNRLGFVYLDRDSLRALSADETLFEAVEGIGMAIGLHGDTFRWDYVLQGEPRLLRPEQREWLQASYEGNHLAQQVPLHTSFYLSGYDLEATWEMLEDDDLCEAAREFGEETGIDFYDELLGQLVGEYAVVLVAADDGMMGRDELPYELLFMADVEDTHRLEDSLGELVEYFVWEEGLDRDDARVGGVEMVFLEEEGRPVLGYGLRDNMLLAATSYDALRLAARTGEENLTANEVYTAVATGLPQRYRVFFYADTMRLRRDLYRSNEYLEEDLEEFDPYLREIAAVALVMEPLTEEGLLRGSVNIVVNN